MDNGKKIKNEMKKTRMMNTKIYINKKKKNNKMINIWCTNNMK